MLGDGGGGGQGGRRPRKERRRAEKGASDRESENAEEMVARLRRWRGKITVDYYYVNIGMAFISPPYAR